jgi:hypothetical protein
MPEKLLRIFEDNIISVDDKIYMVRKEKKHMNHEFAELDFFNVQS